MQTQVTPMWSVHLNPVYNIGSPAASPSSFPSICTRLANREQVIFFSLKMQFLLTIAAGMGLVCLAKAQGAMAVTSSPSYAGASTPTDGAVMSILPLADDSPYMRKEMGDSYLDLADYQYAYESQYPSNYGYNKETGEYEDDDDVTPLHPSLSSSSRSKLIGNSTPSPRTPPPPSSSMARTCPPPP